ncbi:MAG TPA: substrate-binding domain-containing protein [Solirubrobacteraceae bacterium]|jgi:ABC-type sugar transport system substrate-binding protein|nr:substrate-binding domain-containing protein [Solirubrobacteraceae bacterium]
MIAGCGSSSSASSSSASGGKSSGSAGGSSSKPITVAMVPKLVGNLVVETNHKCAAMVAKSQNINLDFTGPVTADVQGQINIYNSLIARRVNVIATSSDNPTEAAPTLERAMRAGIKVVTFDSDVLPAARNLYIGDPSNQAIAEAQVNALVRGLGSQNPKADIAILSSTPTATIQNVWISLMKAYMKSRYPGLHIVTTQYGNGDISQSMTAAENILHAYPNVRGILAPDSLALPGAAEAIDNLGLKGKVVITGLTDPLSIKKYILNGTVQNAFLWDECLQGQEVMYIARLAADGKLPAGPGKIDTPAGSFTIDKDHAIVCCKPLAYNKANVKKYNY